MSAVEEKNLIKNAFESNMLELISLQKNDIISNACTQFINGQFTEAEDYLLTTYPENTFNTDVNALVMMGHIQMRLEQFESAIEYFKQALKCENCPGDFVFDSIGVTNFMKGEYKTAAQNFEEARNFSPNNFNYHYHIAICYETMLITKLENEDIKLTEEDENNDEKLKEVFQLKEVVKKVYDDTLQINPNMYDALLNLGALNACDGLTSVAEKCFKKALQIHENDWKIFINLAYLSLMEKEYKFAVEYFEKAIPLIGENVDKNILVNYMTSLYKIESWKKLEEIAKKVLKIDKKNKKALLYLLKALLRNRKYKQLIELYQKLKLKLRKVKTDNSFDEKDATNPLSIRYVEIKKRIGKLLKEAKRGLKQMEEHAALAKDKSGNRLSDFSDLVQLDMDKINSFGFNAAEIRNLLQLYKNDQNNIDALYHLGMINFKEEEYVKSEEFLLKVHKIDSEYKKHEVCYSLGIIFLFVHKKPKEALEYFEQSLEGGNNELLQVKMGICNELLGDNDKALEYYKNGYEMNKELSSCIFHIGCILDKRNDPDTRTWLEMAYEKEKENVEYLRKFGDFLVRSDNTDDVKKGIIILEKGLEFFIGNIDIMTSLAIGYEKQGRLKEAIKLLDTANNDASFFNNKSKVFRLACYYEKAGNYTKAVEFFKNVLILDNKNIESLLHMGFIYKSCKQYIKSYKCFTKIIEYDPDNIHANYGLGRLYQLLNDRDEEAINFYLKCIKIDPDYNKANIQLGVLYLKIKKIDESFKFLNKVYETEKENAFCLTCLGSIYIEKQEYEEAEKLLLSAIKIDKKLVIAYSALGDALYGMSKYEEAIQKYTYGIKLGGKIPEMFFNLANCYFITQKYDLAITNYIEALKIVQNTRHDYYYFLGNALSANGRLKDAIKAYQAALKLNKYKLLYYYCLGRTYYLDKEYQLAIKYLEKYKELSVKVSEEDKRKICQENECQFLLFKCYSSLPNVDINKCKIIINLLIQKDPKNIKFIDCLASLFEKTNQTNEAVKTYKKILKIDPKNAEAKANLERLEEVDSFPKKKGGRHKK